MSRNRQAGGLERLTIGITPEAMQRLLAECRRRYMREARFIPYGSVISELITGGLPEAVDEAPPEKKINTQETRRKLARTA